MKPSNNQRKPFQKQLILETKDLLIVPKSNSPGNLNLKSSEHFKNLD